MAYLRRFSTTITTDGSGAATAYLPPTQESGRVVEIQYLKVDFTDGVDFTITRESNGQGIWTESNVNASKTVSPTDLNDDLLGAATTGRAYVPLANDRVKIVIAQGGAAKTGTFTVILE